MAVDGDHVLCQPLRHYENHIAHYDPIRRAAEQSTDRLAVFVRPDASGFVLTDKATRTRVRKTGITGRASPLPKQAEDEDGPRDRQHQIRIQPRDGKTVAAADRVRVTVPRGAGFFDIVDCPDLAGALHRCVPFDAVPANRRGRVRRPFVNFQAGLAHLAERLRRKEDVAGSSPATSSMPS